MCNSRSMQDFLIIFDVKWLLARDCCLPLERMNLNRDYFKKPIKWFNFYKGIVVRSSEKDAHIYSDQLFCTYRLTADQAQLPPGTFVEFIPVVDFSHGCIALNVRDIGPQPGIEVLPYNDNIRLAVSNWFMSKEGGLINVPGLCMGISTGSQIFPSPTSRLIIEFSHTFKTFMVVSMTNSPATAFELRPQTNSYGGSFGCTPKVPPPVAQDIKQNSSSSSDVNKVDEIGEVVARNFASGVDERIKVENISPSITPNTAVPNEDVWQSTRPGFNASLPAKFIAPNVLQACGGSFGRNRVLMPIHACPFSPSQTLPNVSVPPRNVSVLPPSTAPSSKDVMLANAHNRRSFASSPTNLCSSMALLALKSTTIDAQISQSATYTYTRSQMIALREKEGKKLEIEGLPLSYNWPSVRSADGLRFYEIFVHIPPSVMRMANSTRIHRAVLMQFRNPVARHVLIRPVASCYLFECGFTFLRFEREAEARGVWMLYQDNPELLRHESGDYFHIQLPQI